MASLDLPAALAAGGDAPTTIHILPAPKGGKIDTADSRGPYTVQSLEAIIAASFARADEIEIDVNHATFLAAPAGGRADAVGWITAMQARDDGIWATVRWTAEGQALVAGQAYRKISPVLTLDPLDQKRIVGIANVSLVNRPNLRGLTALNQEEAMTLLERLAELLGLDAAATEDQVLAAIGKLKKPDVAAQAAIGEIALALGVEGADAKAVVAAAKLAKAGTGDAVALQAQVTLLQGEVDTLKKASTRAKSEAFIDGAIKELRAGVRQSNREELIALHMEQPATVEKMIGEMPKLGPSHARTDPPKTKDGQIALNAEQVSAARLLGIDPEAYRKTLEAERNEENV